MAAVLSAFLAFHTANAQEAQHFCSLDQAVDRLLIAADIPPEMRIQNIPRQIAADIVAAKLTAKPGEAVEIEWKDVYDMRGNLNVWLCQQGYKMNCIGGAIDAVGSGLTGTTVGRAVMHTGLVLSGPPGFVMLIGMGAAQESLQCSPSALKIAMDAGTTVLVMLPWCKAPGIDKACVSAGNSVREGALSAARKIFGKKINVRSIKESANGVEVALNSAVESAEKSATAAGKKTASNLLGNPANGAKPQVNFDGTGGYAGLKDPTASVRPSANSSAAQVTGQTAGRAGATFAAPSISPTVQKAPGLFEKYFTTSKLAQKVKPVDGTFYRGVTPQELERIAADNGLVPKAFHSNYTGISYSSYLEKHGADSMLSAHTQGHTQFMTSLTSDINVARIYGTSKGALLRVRVLNKHAYPTGGFSNFGNANPGMGLPEKEYVVPGRIESKFIEVYDKASNTWISFSEYLRSHPLK